MNRFRTAHTTAARAAAEARCFDAVAARPNPVPALIFVADGTYVVSVAHGTQRVRIQDGVLTVLREGEFVAVSARREAAIRKSLSV